MAFRLFPLADRGFRHGHNVPHRFRKSGEFGIVGGLPHGPIIPRMPLWLIIAIIVLVAARWIVYVIDRNAHVILEQVNAVGRKLEAVEKTVDEIRSNQNENTVKPVGSSFFPELNGISQGLKRLSKIEREMHDEDRLSEIRAKDLK